MTESDAPALTGIRPGTEADVLGGLFSPAGRSDLQVILRSCALLGCRFLFVRYVLRGPGLAAAVS
jgi:hypothetical protein